MMLTQRCRPICLRPFISWPMIISTPWSAIPVCRKQRHTATQQSGVLIVAVDGEGAPLLLNSLKCVNDVETALQLLSEYWSQRRAQQPRDISPGPVKLGFNCAKAEKVLEENWRWKTSMKQKHPESRNWGDLPATFIKR